MSSCFALPLLDSGMASAYQLQGGRSYTWFVS